MYLWDFARVKWIVYAGPLLSCAAGLAGGCAASTAGTAPARSFTPLGVWYSVATTSSIAGGALDHLLDRDFAAIKQMKMNAVFVRHYFPEQLAAVVDAANEHELGLIVSDPTAIRYLRAGAGGEPRFSSAGPLADGSIAARYIGHVVDEETYRRARRLARAARSERPPIALCVSAEPADSADRDMSDFDQVIWTGPGSDEAPATTGGAQTIDCRRHRRDEQTTVRQWLADYHQGLLRGQGGGIVFNAYRALPGNWNGIVSADHPPTPERTAMLRRIIRRSDRWRECLDGLKVRAVQGDPEPPDLKAGLFSGDRLKYLMLVNTSPTRFIRASVAFPAEMGGSGVERAVTVTRAEDSLVGKVLRVRRGELVIPLELGPGEAELFELF